MFESRLLAYSWLDGIWITDVHKYPRYCTRGPYILLLINPVDCDFLVYASAIIINVAEIRKCCPYKRHGISEEYDKIKSASDQRPIAELRNLSCSEIQIQLVFR